ncbi:hypothetical protein Tco_0191145 [Tanacetum coccineum]
MKHFGFAWLLTNEQKAFWDNLRKSRLGYNGPYILSLAYAKIPKLYRAYELCDKNEQLHVFDSEETLEDAEKSRLKMNEFQKDEKVQELKIKPIDYGKLNKLYDDFVPQKEPSAEQTYFPSSFISSKEFSYEIKPSMASMPSANPMLVDLNEMENVFKKLFELLEKNSKRTSIFYTSLEELRLIDICVEAKLILQELHLYFEIFQNRFKRDVKEMKDVFVSVENDLDETLKQNEFLKDRLLEASLAEDVKNLVITSCVEIRNKDLHDEIERISKESKDVSNESKTADTVCNDAFEVTQELSKRIVELEKDLSKFEAKSIAFEIALQHKSRENNSLKTLQKENENFMASLQIENAHLKQTYKDLFESVQRSRVETNECDEAKVKVNFDEIETKNIKLKHRVESLIKENEHLKLTYQSLFDSIKKSRFNNILGKIEFFKKNQFDFFSRLNVDCHISELKKESKENIFVELEKVLTQQTKDFDVVKLELSNRTAKLEAYFEKLEKTKVVLERQLDRKNNALAKLPMLKLGEYEMWEIRIKQYFQIHDYALWEVIENRNSWVPIPVTSASETGFKGLLVDWQFWVWLLLQKISEWDTHVVVWMNKPDFDTMGLDDLYNNFKIVEQKLKKYVGASNDDKNLAFVTTSGASSTNNINTVNPEVSTATTKVNTASTEICTASFSDATVYAFLSTQLKGSQLVHEDLEQLHDDDFEEIDLKWNMTLLSMRARKFYQRTRRKIIIDGSNTAGYDKSKG